MTSEFHTSAYCDEPPIVDVLLGANACSSSARLCALAPPGASAIKCGYAASRPPDRGVQVISDTDHEEHEEVLEWAGGPFDPGRVRSDTVAFDNPQNAGDSLKTASLLVRQCAGVVISSRLPPRRCHRTPVARNVIAGAEVDLVRRPTLGCRVGQSTVQFALCGSDSGVVKNGADVRVFQPSCAVNHAQVSLDAGASGRRSSAFPPVGLPTGRARSPDTRAQVLRRQQAVISVG